MKRLGFFILTILILSLSHAVASEEGIFSTYVDSQGNIEIPKYLFHWTSADSLRRLAQSNPNSPYLPLKPMPDLSHFALRWPQAKGTKALFTWSHPTAAMAANSDSEVYAKIGPLGEPPRLLAMQPNRDAKVVHMVSYLDEPLRDGIIHPEALKDADLVLHEVKKNFGDKEPNFREWIVLNPKKIGWYSADYESFPDEIKNEIINSTRPMAHLKKGEIFINKPISQDETFRKKIIDAYLAGKSEDIPPEFRKKPPPEATIASSAQELSCPKLFTNLSN